MTKTLSVTNFFGAAAISAGLLLTGTASAADITGAGATFPYPIYAKWAEAYKAKTGNGLNYQSIGSGGGIQQIKNKTVDFGATDMPLSGADLQAAGLVQFPMVMGGIVPAVNIKGVESGKLKLTGPILADIYLGKIKKWSDPEIAKINPGMKLPEQAISAVYRSDGSGTTFNFTYYLSQVSPEWKSKVGSNTAVEWPTGLGGKGSEGVTNFVKNTDGAIGFVESAYVIQNKLAYALVQNKDGAFPLPNNPSFQAAAAGADWKSVPGFGVILANQPGKDSWPMTAATFILMYQTTDKAANAAEALKFFDWSYREGGKLAESLDYVPFPMPVVQQIETSWSTMKGTDGKPLWAGASGAMK
jgi:phosphate transport system substrate-binding protein